MASESTPITERETKDELRRRTKELETVFEVSKTLASALHLDALIEGIIAKLVAVVEPADTAALLLYDEKTNLLGVDASFGFERSAISKVYLVPGEAISGKVFESGEALLCITPEDIRATMANLSPENRKYFEAATAGCGHPQSAICAPLIARDQKIGALLIENIHNPGSFDQSDVDFLRALADIIAIAIDKARLHREAEQVRVLEEANRLKSELISTLSHEMRTPLASIKGYASALLMEETLWDEPARREFLEIINDEAQNLTEVISDLLESSMIEAGLLRIEKQPCLIKRLAQRAIETASLRARKHQFAVSFVPGFPVVDADPRRIEQVFHNLLDNAVKYSPNGGLILISGTVGEDEVVVSVSDQGVGIAPEHLNRLFERFFRVRSGLGQHVMGTGLGLPIARTIVEGHGGRIWAESVVGKGTTLFFTIPIRDSDANHWPDTGMTETPGSLTGEE